MKGINRFTVYPLALMLFSQITSATTLDQAKKETAHIKSLNEAKAFMYFNPHAMYRKALTNRPLTVAKTKTCNTTKNGKKESHNVTAIKLNEKGEPVSDDRKYSYNSDGRIILSIQDNQGAEEKAQYSYNTNGALKVRKTTFQGSMEYGGKVHNFDDEFRDEYFYSDNRRTRHIRTNNDYVRGTTEVTKSTYEYDDDFQQYCIVYKNSSNQIDEKFCYDYQFNQNISAYEKEIVSGYSDKKDRKLNRNGDIEEISKIFFSRTNPSDRSITKITCKYDYEQRKFQFYGTEQ